MHFSPQAITSIKLHVGTAPTPFDGTRRLSKSATPFVKCSRFGVLFPAKFCSRETVKIAIREGRVVAK